jgi:4-amino-4-deoxy-L-arabinose transferase-like glycosyltransferase
MPVPDPSPAQACPDPGKWEARIPWILFLVSLGAHLFVALLARLVHNDAVLYLQMARKFFEGDFAGALASHYHPATSLLIAGFRVLVPSDAAAGYATAVVFSSLTVFPLFALARGLFDRRAAVTTVLLYTFLPYLLLFGSSILSEGPYFFFFTSSVWAFWAARVKKSLPHGLAAGALAALAYLSRPEGGGLAIVFLGFCAVWTARSTLGLRSRSLVLGLAVGAAFGAVCFPYLLYLRGETGRWTVSKKKSVTQVVGLSEKRISIYHDGRRAREAPRPADGQTPPGTDEGPLERGGAGTGPVPRHRPPEVHIPASPLLKALASLWEALNRFAQVLFYIPPLVGLLGIVVRRRLHRRWGEEGILLGVVAFFILLCTVFYFHFHYLSRRHLSAAAVVFLPFVAAGIFELAGLLSRAAGRLSGKEVQEKTTEGIAVFLVAVALLSFLPKGFSPYGAGKERVRDIGRMISASEGEGLRIISSNIRIPFYAGGEYFPLPAGDGLSNLLAHAERTGATHLVLNWGAEVLLYTHPELTETFWRRTPGGFRKVLSLKDRPDGHPIVVYRMDGGGGPKQ